MGRPYPRQAGGRRDRLIPISAQWTIFVGGAYVSPLEGAHMGAPLRFVGKFLTATRFEPWPGPVARLGKDLDLAVSGKPDCVRQSRRHEGVGPCGRSRQ